MAGRSAAPLVSLDAAVLDTETTGLDPRNARIVELAAVRLAGGRLEADRHVRRLIHPGIPIPPATTAIHGIDDAAVAGASDFASAWPEVAAFLGETAIVGHSIGFDLAMLRNECERAKIVWHAPPALDTELLARIALPGLAAYSLESIAAQLGIEATGRHSALGDAITTGRIYCALVPKLRERGIRTLAEATRACLNMHGALEDRHRAGWSEAAPVWSRPAEPRARRPSGVEPYRHCVGTIMTAPPRIVTADVSLHAALKLMAEERISSLFVGSGAAAGEMGIVTERDVLRVLNARGAAGFEVPVGEVMSKPLVTVASDALAYVAVGRMNRLGIRHLGVTGDSGAVIGALTARDLLRLRGEGAIELGDELATAGDVHDLAQSWTKLTQVAADLRADGLAARDIAALVSQNVVEITGRAAELAEAAMVAAGRGGAPCRYAVVVLGSAGRGESLLAMDQDNALVHADDAPEGVDEWFEPFAVRLNDILHEAGIPYCKGGIMAKNPAWRGSETEWRSRVERWISRSKPEDLLSADIFFDLRVASGDAGLADRLWRHSFDVAQGKPEFAKLLIAGIGAMPAGRSWLGGFRTEQGRIDLKRTGLFGIVSVARALAICHHVVRRSTPERVSGLIALKLGLETDLEALIEAQGVLLDLILGQQIEDITHGRPVGNTVEIKRLSRRDRSRLSTALQAAENLDEIARSLLFRN